MSFQNGKRKYQYFRSANVPAAYLFPQLINLLEDALRMRHDKVMRTRKNLPNHIVLAAHKRKALDLVVFDVDNLIVLRQQDHCRARLSARKEPPALMLVRQGRVPNRGHE